VSRVADIAAFVAEPRGSCPRNAGRAAKWTVRRRPASRLVRSLDIRSGPASQGPMAAKKDRRAQRSWSPKPAWLSLDQSSSGCSGTGTESHVKALSLLRV
jgi:hypothetical protein